MNISEEIYKQIVRLMPIPCVDLLVTDKSGRVLMLRRMNHPAKDQWWFPGGRVLHGERRIDAARRKLKEECGGKANEIGDLGTYDLIFDSGPSDYASHAITTVFHMVVDQVDVCLDNQSTAYAWKSPVAWLKEVNHEFLLSVLRLFVSCSDKGS